MTLDKNKRSVVFIVSGIDPAKTKSYRGSPSGINVLLKCHLTVFHTIRISVIYYI